MTKLFVFCAFFSLIFCSFTEHPFEFINNCPEPTNVQLITGDKSVTTLTWNQCNTGCTDYAVICIRTSDNQVIRDITTSSTSVSFVGLTNETHCFSVQTICEELQSEIIVIEELIAN